MPRRAPEPRSPLTLLLALALHAALLGAVLMLPRGPTPPQVVKLRPPLPPLRRPGPHGGGGSERGLPPPRTKEVRPLEPKTPPTAIPVEEPPPVAAAQPSEEPGADASHAGATEGSPGAGSSEGTAGIGIGPGGTGPGSGTPGDDEGDPAVDASPGPRILTSEMVPPVLVRRVDPEYPRIAAAAGAHGTVVLSCIIQADGSVTVSAVAHSVALLDDAAVSAVTQWRYEPAQWNGRPQAVYQTIKLQFTRR